MEWQARQPRVSNSCFAVLGVARLLLGQRVRETRLPEIGRDRLNLMIGQTEVRHLGGRAEIGWLFQPHRNPVAIQLEADVFQVRADFLDVLHQAVGLEIELLDAAVDLAVGNPERHRLLVQPVGFVVTRGRVGLLHQVGGCF